MRVAFRRPLTAAAALATLALGACVDDGQTIVETPIPANGGELFLRYVALGNSITAGFQSGGLTAVMQDSSYPRLLAARASVQRFGQPYIAGLGCPQPMTAPLTPAPASPAGAPCARVDSASFTQNLAVPGVRIADLFTTPTNPLNATQRFYALLTGGRSQVNAMIASDPTFVSVWIGNNDALSAALGGVLGPTTAGADSNLTRLSVFQGHLNALVDSIKRAGPQGALLIGVVDAVIAAPLIQPGAYFFLARDAATNRFQGKLVNANCSPVTALGTPNPLAANMVSFQIVSDAAFPEINCDPAAYPVGDPRRGVYLLDTAEQAVVRTRIAQYNAAIQAAANANGWAYADPNAILGPLLIQKNAQNRYQNVRKCQDLATATTAAQFQTAVLNSCPVTGTTAAPGFFGTLISFDGVHPSTAAHKILATEFARIINTKYGTQINLS
ncbi:MAG TPA: SGNH/GDSL hydrolase family protein [Longimicrobium sp.]|nr:SGNH/GDSL hydrolase family protein [Longimicrobium sp.]